jgi:hypothetical protein
LRVLRVGNVNVPNNEEISGVVAGAGVTPNKIIGQLNGELG